MTVKKRTKANSSVSVPQSHDPPSASVQGTESTTYGLSQFKGENLGFYLRQFGGLLLVVLGTLVLATSYSDDYRLLPEWISTTQAGYISFFIISLGAVVHELRPWKRLEYIRAQMNSEESAPGTAKKVS